MKSKSASFTSEDFFNSLCLQVSHAIKVTEQLLGLGHSTSCIDCNCLTFQKGTQALFE
jgi:hypothetical protein